MMSKSLFSSPRIITNNKSAIITRGFKSNKYIGFNTEAVSFLKQGY